MRLLEVTAAEQDRQGAMASREELEWWNKFADVMAEQWTLTPAMNAMIRADYENDYATYLFKAKGTFLEVGCGTGWIGQKFAERGMQVDGIDFSDGQLDIARRLAADKGLNDVAYFVRDLVNDRLNGRFTQYDAVLVNAVLHHLSVAEVEALMVRIAAVLAPGGRLYIYEPLAPRGGARTRQALVYPIGFAIRVLLFAINVTGKAMRLFKKTFADAMRRGYTGSSPDEKPIPIDILRRSIIAQGLAIVEERPFHSYSIAVAMSIVRLKPMLVAVLSPAVRIFCALDRLMFKTVGWQNLGNDWSVLCSIKVERPAVAGQHG